MIATATRAVSMPSTDSYTVFEGKGEAGVDPASPPAGAKIAGPTSFP